MSENSSLETVSIRKGEDFIRLGQAMKKCGMVDSGVDAKICITDGHVSVNGEVEVRRGRKLVPGDVIRYEQQEIRVVAEE